MAKRGNNLGLTEKTGSGATPDNNGLTTGVFIATGVCAAAPVAGTIGSLKATFALGGTTATVLAVAAHREANGKDPWNWFGKDDDKKSDDKKKEDKKDS